MFVRAFFAAKKPVAAICHGPGSNPAIPRGRDVMIAAHSLQDPTAPQPPTSPPAPPQPEIPPPGPPQPEVPPPAKEPPVPSRTPVQDPARSVGNSPQITPSKARTIKDDQDRSQAASGVIAPTCAIRPGRQCADQQDDHDHIIKLSRDGPGESPRVG